MGLRDVEATLPPGFRFAPSDEELVCHYLYEKISSKRPSKDTMVEVNLHICEPWQLPDMAKLGANEWYFFSFRDRKYSTGFRANRSTSSGYWKATGKDRVVFEPTTGAVVGMRKTLVFYNGRAPNGIKSGWVMHEFRLENGLIPPKEDWVLCRVFNKDKGELITTTHAMQSDYNNSTVLVSSPNHYSCFPAAHTMITGYQQQFTSFPQNQNHEEKDPRILLDLSALSPTNIIDQAPHQNMICGEPINIINEINSKSGDGILLDLLFEDNVLEDSESLDFEEMGFNEHGHFP